MLSSSSSHPSTGVTFDVDPAKVPKYGSTLLASKDFNGLFAGRYLIKCTWNTKTETGTILHSTGDGKHFVGEMNNGFINACASAYNEHYPLELSPDNVWLAIITAFASYIDQHAESLRSKFVSHDGKKKLIVKGYGSIETANWDHLIDLMSASIDNYTKRNIRDLIECNFTTTDKISRTTSKLTLMGSMKNYFDYGFDLLCGLPKVRLDGTLEDWINVRKRVDCLIEYDIDGTIAKWVPLLQYVLDNFVETYKQAQSTSAGGMHRTGGISDELKNFWNRIVHYKGGGSGPTYLSGWIIVFTPFDKFNEYCLKDITEVLRGKFGKIDTEYISDGVCETPVEVNDNGTLHQCKFYSGQFMAEYRQGYVRPSIDWVLTTDTIIPHAVPEINTPGGN